jgi:ribosome-binding ATPase YchF (GTP1/OBG family)
VCNVAEDHAGAAMAHIEGNGVGNFDHLPSTVINYLDSVKIKASENGSKCVALSATLEATAAAFEGEGQIEYLQMAGLNKVPSHVQDKFAEIFTRIIFYFKTGFYSHYFYLLKTGLATVIQVSAELLKILQFYTGMISFAKKQSWKTCITIIICFSLVGPKEARSWSVRQGASASKAAGVIHSDFERLFIRAETISYSDFVEFGGTKGAREAGKLRMEGKDYICVEGDVFHFLTGG